MNRITFQLFWLSAFAVFIFCAGNALAQDADESSAKLTTHFRWVPESKDMTFLLLERGSAKIGQGKLTLSGTTALKGHGEKLLRIINAVYGRLDEKYGFQPGRQNIHIPLLRLKTVDSYDFNYPVLSKQPNRLDFPFPVDPERPASYLETDFAVFNLIHTIIKADLAFGNDKRSLVSAHAYRFVDGLSGYLALTSMEELFAVDRKKILRFLDIKQLKEDIATRYAADQILSQNKGSANDAVPGYMQFLAGVNLRRDSGSGLKIRDSSTASSRIAVFTAVREMKGEKGFKKIFGYLASDADIWKVKDQDDNFCVTIIKVGCKDTTIDGSRADLILEYVTDKTFLELLADAKKEAPPSTVDLQEEIPPYPIYGFDFPKVGGANRYTVELAYERQTVAVTSHEIITRKHVVMGGGWLSIGLRDEAHKVLIQLKYSLGDKKLNDEFVTFNGTEYKLPATLTRNDFQGGTRIIQRGEHTGWLNEIGFYLHWNRFNIEWDTSGVAGQTRDKEFINRSFFLFDVQNYNAIQAGIFTLGMNTDFQIGTVNHTGSTEAARDGKFSTDNTAFILGANIGPEIRVKAGFLDLRVGASLENFWQPFDDEGGRSSGDNDINSTQRSERVYGSLALSF